MSLCYREFAKIFGELHGNNSNVVISQNIFYQKKIIFSGAEKSPDSFPFRTKSSESLKRSTKNLH